MTSNEQRSKKGVTLRWRYRFVLFYVALLFLSHAVRFFQPEEGPLLPEQVRVALPEVDGEKQTENTIQLAYRDFAPTGLPDAPVLVLIHGSPMGSQAMDGLISELRDDFRLIVPDLPGVGGSTLAVADYSGRAHAKYVLALLRHLEITEAHFLAYSQGGAVVLNIIQQAPEQVVSLTMLAAIGVQELELLGDYTLNHGLYGLQWLALAALQEGVPHFGYIDTSLLNVHFARNIWDTDQRPLREILLNYEQPMLILHGREDFLVPWAAAEEHARLVPQSEFVTYESGHMLPFQNAAQVAGDVRRFVAKVESGTALSRGQISSEKRELAQAPMPKGERLSSSMQWVYGLLLVLGTFVSEDLTCIGGGLLASRGVISFTTAVVGCFLGIFLSDMWLYLMGRYLGRAALVRAPFKWFIREQEVLRMQRWFDQKGALLVISSRFVPGSRLPVYFAAGMVDIPMKRFVFLFGAAALVWTPILVGLAYQLGDQVVAYFESFEEYAWLGLVAIIAFIVVFRTLVVPALTWKGRRLLLSAWRRRVRWEFWPMWALYLPVVFYLLYLGVKHRSFMLFTAVNPAMPQSGFVEESKSDILKGLSEAEGAMPHWTVLPVEWSLDKKQAAFAAFRKKHQLDYPIVLKPDVGQRGEAVAIVRSDEAAFAYLKDTLEAVVVQEYAGGEEYGVFYYRYPNQEQGRIFGITDKRFTQVTGDGRRTLEELILGDDRTVSMAPFFLKKYADCLDDVLPKGKEMMLAELGTHCRGALFLDGERLITPELEAVIDRMSRKYEGFYFGRYDIKAPSAEALSRGENLKILELNGVTSEGTFIYDPKHSVFFGWKMLCRQWRIAFEIAEQNAKKGHSVTPFRALLNIVLQSKAKEKMEV